MSYTPSIYPGLRFPFEQVPPCHPPPGAATFHLEMSSHH
jgi:hypothetical protein